MAHAVAPLPSLDGLITDQAGVFDGQTSEIETAQANFHTATGGQFYVVFIDSFDGMAPETWARTTAENANLTSVDVLLVVSPGDPNYYVDYGGDFVFTDAQRNALISTMENSLGAGLENRVTWQAAIANIIGAFQNELANETTVQGTEPAPEGVQNDGAVVDETTPAPTPAPTAPAATGGLPTAARVALIALGALAALFALWLLLGKYNEKRLAKRAEENPFNI
jgi:hypothetical protein